MKGLLKPNTGNPMSIPKGTVLLECNEAEFKTFLSTIKSHTQLGYLKRSLKNLIIKEEEDLNANGVAVAPMFPGPKRPRRASSSSASKKPSQTAESSTKSRKRSERSSKSRRQSHSGANDTSTASKSKRSRKSKKRKRSRAEATTEVTTEVNLVSPESVRRTGLSVSTLSQQVSAATKGIDNAATNLQRELDRITLFDKNTLTVESLLRSADTSSKLLKNWDDIDALVKASEKKLRSARKSKRERKRGISGARPTHIVFPVSLIHGWTQKAEPLDRGWNEIKYKKRVVAKMGVDELRAKKLQLKKLIEEEKHRLKELRRHVQLAISEAATVASSSSVSSDDERFWDELSTLSSSRGGAEHKRKRRRVSAAASLKEDLKGSVGGVSSGLHGIDMAKYKDMTTVDLATEFRNLLGAEATMASASGGSADEEMKMSSIPGGSEEVVTGLGVVGSGEKRGLLPDDELPGKLYCICRKAYDRTVDMICCDFCEEWYHTSCVGMESGEVDSMAQQKYKCMACVQMERSGKPLADDMGDAAASSSSSSSSSASSSLSSTSKGAAKEKKGSTPTAGGSAAVLDTLRKAKALSEEVDLYKSDLKRAKIDIHVRNDVCKTLKNQLNLLKSTAEFKLEKVKSIASKHAKQLAVEQKSRVLVEAKLKSAQMELERSLTRFATLNAAAGVSASSTAQVLKTEMDKLRFELQQKEQSYGSAMNRLKMVAESKSVEKDLLSKDVMLLTQQLRAAQAKQVEYDKVLNRMRGGASAGGHLSSVSEPVSPMGRTMGLAMPRTPAYARFSQEDVILLHFCRNWLIDTRSLDQEYLQWAAKSASVRNEKPVSAAEGVAHLLRLTTPSLLTDFLDDARRFDWIVNGKADVRKEDDASLPIEIRSNGNLVNIHEFVTAVKSQIDRNRTNLHQIQFAKANADFQRLDHRQREMVESKAKLYDAVLKRFDVRSEAYNKDIFEVKTKALLKQLAVGAEVVINPNRIGSVVPFDGKHMFDETAVNYDLRGQVVAVDADVGNCTVQVLNFSSMEAQRRSAGFQHALGKRMILNMDPQTLKLVSPTTAGGTASSRPLAADGFQQQQHERQVSFQPSFGGMSALVSQSSTGPLFGSGTHSSTAFGTGAGSALAMGSATGSGAFVGSGSGGLGGSASAALFGGAGPGFSSLSQTAVPLFESLSAANNGAVAGIGSRQTTPPLPSPRRGSPIIGQTTHFFAMGQRPADSRLMPQTAAAVLASISGSGSPTHPLVVATVQRQREQMQKQQLVTSHFRTSAMGSPPQLELGSATAAIDDATALRILTKIPKRKRKKSRSRSASPRKNEQSQLVSSEDELDIVASIRSKKSVSGSVTSSRRRARALARKSRKGKRKSLSQRSSENTAEIEEELFEAVATDGNESICRICGLGGNLFCCENCPSAWHRECMRPMPSQAFLDAMEDWFCRVCAGNHMYVPMKDKVTGAKLPREYEPMYRDLADFQKNNSDYVRDWNPEPHPSLKCKK